MSPHKEQIMLLAAMVFTTVLAAAGIALLTVSTDMFANWFTKPTSPSGNTPAMPDMQLNLTEADLPDSVWLGIIGATVRPGMAQAMGLPPNQTGVLVQFIESSSPAQQAGIQGSEDYVTEGEQRWLVGGDIIIAFDDQPVNSMQDLRALLAQAEPAQVVKLTLLRNGQEINLTTSLTTYPNLELTSPVPGLQVT